MLVPSYDQPLQKLCFWNDCKNRGLGTLGWNFEDFCYKDIKINYKNRGFANLTTSILQKYSISNKKSAARGRFFWKDDWDCRIFDRSYFFLGPIKETPCIYSGQVRPRQGTEICNFGAPSPLEALHWIFCFSSSIYVQFSKTSPLKSGESSGKSSGENCVRSCHVCGCHGFLGPDLFPLGWYYRHYYSFSGFIVSSIIRLA